MSAPENFMDIICASNLTYKQKLLHLAQAAENSVNPIKTSADYDRLFAAEAICDMHEGNAPYRPRYVCPDYEAFAKNGSAFLRIDAPKDLDDLLWDLSVLYDNVPSVTSRPVYVGQLDKIIDPFLKGMTDEEIKPRLKRFLNFVDRTVASGYSHANLGPEETRAGRLLLEVEQELCNTVPNFTLKYDPDVTPDDFARLAVETTMVCSNPAFANHQLNSKAYQGLDYSAVSCYNILPIGGGAYCLDRVLLPRLADLASGVDDFMNDLLPLATGEVLEYMNNRIKFLVEESNFFQSSFLVADGLLHRDRFVGMFGVAGMSECVKKLLKLGDDRAYGTDAEANELADKIMQQVYKQVMEFPAVYSEASGGHYTIHAQGGFSDQPGVTPGVRLKVGDEPEVLFDHIRMEAPMHRFFDSGVSDIFPAEPTAKNNPDALLDVIKAAFSIGDKYLSFYSSDGDLVRITGFLAKRSEMEKFQRGEAVLQDTSHDGEGAFRANNLGERRVERV